MSRRMKAIKSELKPGLGVNGREWSVEGRVLAEPTIQGICQWLGTWSWPLQLGQILSQDSSIFLSDDRMLVA